MRLPARAWLAATAVAVIAAVAGGWLLAGPADRAERRHVVVDGVPLDEVHPPGARHPGVVVAHGFAGSARLMAPFGDSLAAAGFVVVLLDFSGHGANTGHADLQDDLDVAVRHLRALPDVDPARVSLVGHSMGATAVTTYAVAHPQVTATVAISLPDASVALPNRPARFLPIVGGLEFAGFRTAATEAAGGGPRVVVPGVEHISILYAQRTHTEVVKWLSGHDDAPLPSPLRRPLGAGLLLFALLAGMYPVARLLLGPGRTDRPTPAGRAVAVALAATGVAAVAAKVLPTRYLPLAVGDYVAGFTLAAGVLMIAYHRWRRIPPVPEPSARPAGLLLIPYAAVTIALPLHLGITHAVPVGPRWWLLPIVWAGFAALAYAGELFSGPIVSGVTVLVLSTAAVAGLAPGFVLLVVPLLVVLLAGQAAWSALLHRLAAPAWLIALAGSLLVAWPVVVALPLA